MTFLVWNKNQFSIFRNVSNILPRWYQYISHPTTVATLKTVFPCNKGKMSLPVPSSNQDLHIYTYFFTFPNRISQSPQKSTLAPLQQPFPSNYAGQVTLWRQGKVLLQISSRLLNMNNNMPCPWFCKYCIIVLYIVFVNMVLKDKTLQIWWFAKGSHRTSFLLRHTSIKVFSEKWNVFGLFWKFWLR